MGLALLAAVANTAWVVLDRTSPSWDQASYLYLAGIYNDAVGQSGLGSLFDTMQASDPSRGPLFILGLMPAMAVLGDDATTALVLNAVLAPVAYLAAGEIAYQVFRSWSARLLAIVVTACTPLLVGLQHDVLVDFLLTTLTCLSVMFLLKSHLLSRRWMAVLMGVAMGLGTLTKVTFPVFVLGPVVVLAVRLVVLAVRRDRTPGLLPRLANLGLALVAYAAVVLPWYLPNRQATLDYVRSTTSGDLAVGAGPSQPLTLHNMTSFAVSVINDHLSWPLFITAVVVLLVGLVPLVEACRTNPVDRWNTLTVGSWILVPYVVLMTGSNQDVRLMAPAFAGVAVAVAGGLASIRTPALRVAVSAVAVSALVLQSLLRLVPVGPGWLPDQATVTAGSWQLRMPIASSVAIGYDRLPRKDRTTPLFEWMEQRAAVDGEGRATGVVCLLVSYPYVNSNTFRFYNLARDDAFEMRDVLIGPGGAEQLAADLSACTFAMYDPERRRLAQAAAQGDSVSRLDFVNDPYASSHMTRSMLRTFDGPSRVFKVGDASRAPSDAWPPDTSTITLLARHDEER